MKFDPSVPKILGELNERCPGVKLLSLGQTIFWDEPMKASIRLMLDQLGIQTTMIAGIHDTDYFAKLKTAHVDEHKFIIVPHNDASTRGLWSAACEVARLFGSETVITRERYQQAGVPIDRVARYYSGGREVLLEQITEAWGWRGLVYTGDSTLVPHNLPIREVAEPLRELLEWAFNGTYESITSKEIREKAQEIGDGLLKNVTDHAEQFPDWTLSQLYQHLISDFYEMLLGYKPTNFEVECSAHMLILNKETAKLPRFEFVDLFLRPETRAICEKAYNEAVADSEIYTLDRFGEGAIPFDLVLPNDGRGTLRITDNQLVALTPEPRFVTLKHPIRSVHDLAEVLVENFGDHATVVGKAVSLISMLANEFIFVFNETGSGYVWRTRKMNEILAANGINLNSYPILRVKYHTWDSLTVPSTWFQLPEHLTETFGQKEISSSSFAHRWEAVVETQKQVLARISKTHRIRDLISTLQELVGGHWETLADEYSRLQQELSQRHSKQKQGQDYINELYDRIRRYKREYVELEKEKGDNFRAILQPLQLKLTESNDLNPIEMEIASIEAMRKIKFDDRLKSILKDRAAAHDEIMRIRQEREERERNPEAIKMRERRRNIVREAELARIHLVRNAILSSEGLTHPDHRPTAWWLPMVCPKGCWFEQIVETAELYLEELK